MSGTESVRRVMTQATCVVNEEFDRLHRDLREKDELIKIKQHDLERAWFDANNANWRRKKSEETTDFAIVGFYCALVVAFVAIGYAVWIGGYVWIY